MRENAKANPNSWLYVFDPAFDNATDVPPWGVLGAYPVDGAGEIDGEFYANPSYRPSPPILGAPALDANPREPGLDELIALVNAGHAKEADLAAALLDATLLLYATSERDNRVTGFPDRTGTIMVPACTSRAHVPSAWPGWRPIRGRELVPLLRGHALVVNPVGPVSAIVPAECFIGPPRA
jgi:SseB protein N-terminal domain